MRAAIYARVSSSTQRDARTIESQLPACREIAQRNGWTVVGEYIDDGISASAGNLDRRLGLLRLLADAETGAFDLVVTYDEDRLTRSDRLRERGYILGSLQEARVKIATVTKGSIIDLNTDEGDLAVSFGGLQSSSWLRKHKARIKSGKSRAIAEGRKPAGPTPFGYDYDRATGKWSPHPINAALVVEMFQRVAAGAESCRAIADDLDARGQARPRGGRWSRERVHQIVTKRTYLGEWTADKAKKLTIAVPPLIDEALWQRAQAALVSHGKRGLRRVKHVYLLEGLAVCGACGAKIGIRSANQRTWKLGGSPAAYVCGHRRRPPLGEPPCGAPCVPVADADARVWEAVERELLDQDLLDYIIALEQRRAGDRRDWAGDEAATRRRLQKLEHAENGILRRYREGLVSDAAVDTELGELKKARTMALQQLATAQRAQAGADARNTRLAEVRRQLDDLRARVKQATPAERQQIVAALVAPGAAVLAGKQVRLTLLVEAEASAAAVGAGPELRVVQPDTAGSISVPLTNLKIRTVA